MKANLILAAVLCSGFITAGAQNLIRNPRFRSGSIGWNFYSHEQVIGWNSPEKLKKLLLTGPARLDGDVLILPESRYLRSELFNYIPKQKYTILIRMKNANPGKQSKVRAFLIDGTWQICATDFTLTDQFKTYTFIASLPRTTPLNRAYFRLDPKGNSVAIDRVQLVKGDKQFTFLPDAPVEFAIRGKNLLYTENKNSPLKLRVFRSGELKKAIPVEVKIFDNYGKCISSKTYTAKPVPEQSFEFKVNPAGTRGLFEIKVTGGGASYRFPYMVVRDLRKLKLKENPAAGHLAPNIPNKTLADLNGVLGFQQSKYNRIFYNCNVDKSAPLPADVRKFFKDYHRCNVINFENRVGDRWTDPEITPAHEKAFEERLRKIIRHFGDAIQGIELFNEPELWRYKDGPNKNAPSMKPEKVARYYQITRRVINKEAPNLKLFGPCVWYDYGKTVLKTAGPIFDVYTFHNYCTNCDVNDFQRKVKEYQAILRKMYGHDVPMWNNEEYFGINNIKLPLLGDCEHGRPYFADTALDHAGRCANTLVHHAARGVSWSNFCLEYLWSGLALDENEIFPAAPAVNLAIEKLSNAGRGDEYPLGDAVKCFVFPHAEKGPLAVVYAAEYNENGELIPAKGMNVTDDMGNPVRNGKTRLTNLPVYIQFAKGADWKKELTKLSFCNIGEPFRGRAVISGEREVTYTVTNRTNNVQKVKITLNKIPEGMICKEATRSIQLEPGKNATLVFKFTGKPFAPMTKYLFRFRLRNGDEMMTEKFRMSMLTANRGNSPKEIKKWFRIPKEQIAGQYIPGVKWGGPQDLTVKFGCCWNPKSFILSVIVRDDKTVFPTASYDYAWNYDSLQVYFDPKRDATPEADLRGRNRSDDVEYIIGNYNGKKTFAYLDLACDIRFVGEQNLTKGLDPDVKVKFTRLASDQVRYDVEFPAAVLPYLKLKAGNVFGFSLLVNDNDNGRRKQSVSLAPAGTEPFGHPANHCDMILMP